MCDQQHHVRLSMSSFCPPNVQLARFFQPLLLVGGELNKCHLHKTHRVALLDKPGSPDVSEVHHEHF